MSTKYQHQLAESRDIHQLKYITLLIPADAFGRDSKSRSQCGTGCGSRKGAKASCEGVNASDFVYSSPKQ